MAEAEKAARPLRMERRMTDTEAVMWHVERDPILRSAFTNLTFLDRAPDVDRFRRRMAKAVRTIPRLRQRVVSPPAGIGPPAWADDPDFDLGFHIRHVALPAPATERQLLDLAALLHEDAFDPARPLWQFTIVEGSEGERAALIAKMHHTISDGVGAVRLSAMFIDVERDPVGIDGDEDIELPPPSTDGDGDGAGGLSLFEAAGEAIRRPLGLGWRALSGVAGAVTRPIDATGTAWAAVRQLIVTDGARSPLWSVPGKRSAGRRYEILSADLERAKEAAHRRGGTLNDLYVTAIVGAAGKYHRAKGAPVDELRASIPVSTRSDKSAGGNAFLPARVLVPAGIEDPDERFRAVHERMTALKEDRSLGFTEGLAGLISGLPAPVLTKLARSQTETVDFAASNVRGAPFDLYIAGAHVLANHPFGPTGGTAFNATVLSYRGSMDIGLNIDTAAIDDGPLLRELTIEAFNELL